MASDEIVWQVINQQFCSYKLKTTKDQTFCRNEYNVTGLCSRQACPLANSRYATIRSNPETGVLYLFMKTVERSHMPSKWWERIRLSSNYSTALEQVDERLKYWPKFLTHKCKQRLTRLTQVAIRTKRLLKEEQRLGERTVTKMAPKVRKREEARERKAEAAAKVERAIERELIERLTSGAYGDKPLNADERVWKKVMKAYERRGEGLRDKDLDEGIEEDEEELEEEFEGEEEDAGNVEYVSDIDGESDDQDGLGDLEDWLEGDSAADTSEDEEDEDQDSDEDEGEDLKKALAGLKRKREEQGKPRAKGGPKPSKKANRGPRREIEYEIDEEPRQRERLLA